MYIHTHSHSYLHTGVYTLTFHICSQIYTCKYVLSHIYPHTHTQAHTHMYTRLNTHTHTHTLERTQAHTHAQPRLSFPGPINPVFSAFDHEWHEAEWGGHPFLRHCPGQWYREAGTGLTRPLCSLVPGWGQRLVGSCPPPSAFALLAQIWTDPAAGGGR